MRVTPQKAALAVAALLGLQMAAGVPAATACQVSLVDEPFNGTSLASEWQVVPGKGSYALTGDALRYTIDAYGWVSGSEALRLVRRFDGDNWTLRTQIVANLRPAEPVNNRILHFQVRSGDRTLALVSRGVGVYDGNPNSNSLFIAIGDELQTFIFPNTPSPLPVEHWLLQITRNGDSITVLASDDGDDSDFEYSFGPRPVPGLTGASQEMVIRGTGWWGSNDPPGYADFAKITVDTATGSGCSAQLWRRVLAGPGTSLTVDPADHAVVLTAGSPPSLTKYTPSGGVRWRRAAISGAGSVVSGPEGITVAGSLPPRLARYNSAGQRLWTRTLSLVSAGGAISGMARAADGSLVVFAVEADGERARLIKYDGNGLPMWQRALGPYEWISLRDLAVGTTGRIAALTYEDWGYEASRYSASGQRIWQRTVGVDEDDIVNGIAVDAAGGVAVAGDSLNTESPLTVVAWVKRYAAGGTHRWQATVEPRDVGVVQGTAVAIAADGRCHLLGTTFGALAGEPMSVAGGTDRDIFLARLSPDGRRLWQKRLVRDGDQYAVEMDRDTHGNLLLLGNNALIKLTP